MDNIISRRNVQYNPEKKFFCQFDERRKSQHKWEKVIDKSSFIFPTNQFYLIKFYFGSNSKFLGPIDFSHFSHKKILIINLNFLLATMHYVLRKMKELLLNNFVSNTK